MTDKEVLQQIESGKLMRIEEAVKYSGLKRQRIYFLASPKVNRLSCIKYHGKLYFSKDDLNEYKKKRYVRRIAR